ncbi:MAG: hypothetical protein JWR80_10023 [Bradyrhizobium sp.]|nr:hypothetical protein [Bradyrhizobium sp.]
MTPESRRDAISAVSVAMGAELLVVLAIIVGAAVGVNVGAVTSAIANWIG